MPHCRYATALRGQRSPPRPNLQNSCLSTARSTTSGCVRRPVIVWGFSRSSLGPISSGATLPGGGRPRPGCLRGLPPSNPPPTWCWMREKKSSSGAKVTPGIRWPLSTGPRTRRILKKRRHYLYFRASQKEPFDMLYCSPALTTIVNVVDHRAALHDAFGRAAATGQVVMTVTLSNACPVEGGTPGAVGHLNCTRRRRADAGPHAAEACGRDRIASGLAHEPHGPTSLKGLEASGSDSLLDPHGQGLIVRRHGNHPEANGESKKCQEIDDYRKVILASRRIPGDVSKVRQG